MKGWFKFPVLTLTLSCVLFLQFYNLGKLPIVQWDESRLAVNAAEMSQTGSYLVTTFKHQPDLYNTKPPLMIWMQVISIKLFGLNEFAVRFPSALAGFLTILLTGLFVYRINSNWYASCLAMGILASCYGFIQLHGSMTGDYDALLALFIVLAVFFIYSYFMFSKQWMFYMFIVSVAFSIMTKSAAALILYPVYIALFFYLSGLKHMVKLALWLFMALIPFVIFCIVREKACAGYLDDIWKNDFGGRFAGVVDGHVGEWYYYIAQLFTFRFSWFIWCLPIAMAWGIYKRHRDINFMSVIWIVYLFIVSTAQTKLEWYDIPLLPFISISIALFVFDVYSKIDSKIFSAMFLFPVIALLFWATFLKYKFIVSGEGIRLSTGIYDISEKLRTHRSSEKLTYFSYNYDAWYYFYTLANPAIERVDYNNVKSGQAIIMDREFYDSLDQRYNSVTLDSQEFCKTVRVTGVK